MGFKLLTSEHENTPKDHFCLCTHLCCIEVGTLGLERPPEFLKRKHSFRQVTATGAASAYLCELSGCVRYACYA